MGGGGRPNVRYKVGNGHIRLVTHRRDHRQLRLVDSPSHPLVVESPQILDGSATPAGDNQISHPPAVGVADGPHDLRRRLCPLDPDGQELYRRLMQEKIDTEGRVALFTNGYQVVEPGDEPRYGTWTFCYVSAPPGMLLTDNVVDLD